MLLLIPISLQNIFGDGIGVIDQSVTNPGMFTTFSVTTTQGQSFIPSQNNLVAVDLFLVDRGGMSTDGDYDLVINIREDTVNGQIVQTTSKQMIFSQTRFAGPQIVHVHFSSPAVITPGQSYVIQAETSPPLRADWQNVGQKYTLGRAIVGGTPSSIGADFGFRTYYDPNFGLDNIVIGGTIIPIDRISLLVGFQNTDAWLIPLVMSIIGINYLFFKKRNFVKSVTNMKM